MALLEEYQVLARAIAFVRVADLLAAAAAAERQSDDHMWREWQCRVCTCARTHDVPNCVTHARACDRIPLALLALRKGVTVICCHVHTVDLRQHTLNAGAIAMHRVRAAN